MAAIDGAARAKAGPMVQAGRQGSFKRPTARPTKTREAAGGKESDNDMAERKAGVGRGGR